METENKINQAELEAICQKVLKDYDVANNVDVTDIEIWFAIRAHLFHKLDEPIPPSPRETSDMQNYFRHIQGIIDKHGDELEGEHATTFIIRMINKAKGRSEP